MIDQTDWQEFHFDYRSQGKYRIDDFLALFEDRFDFYEGNLGQIVFGISTASGEDKDRRVVFLRPKAKP